MKRYDRTWPTSVAAMSVGALAGLLFFGRLLAPAPAPDHAIADTKPQTVRFVRAGDAPRTPRGVIQVGQPSISDTDDLLRTLRSPDVRRERRRSAAIMLGSSSEPGRVLGALMIALRTDPDGRVRRQAAYSLGRLEQPAASGPLQLAARLDTEPRVRAAAVTSLGLIGDAGAIPVLIEALETDFADVVRAEAVRSLLLFRDRESLEALYRAQRADPGSVASRVLSEELSRLTADDRHTLSRGRR